MASILRRALVTLLAAIMLALAPSGPALAIDPDEKLSDAKLEQRARDISVGLRCLVCQNQSIDDSDAALAKDLRVVVRERLVAGDSDRQVIDYVVSRYGEFVLLKPPVNQRTLLLWIAPGLILLLALAYVGMRLRSPRLDTPEVVMGPAAQLTDAERRELDQILQSSDTASKEGGRNETLQ